MSIHKCFHFSPTTHHLTLPFLFSLGLLSFITLPSPPLSLSCPPLLFIFRRTWYNYCISLISTPFISTVTQRVLTSLILQLQKFDQFIKKLVKMKMRGELVLVGFLLCMVWGMVAAQTPSLGDQCADEFQKVTTCLTFATGKATTPSKECCTSVTDIKQKNPVCLCYFIQQIHSGTNAAIKNMGIQEARLLQLPSACKLSNASTAECPQLLHLAPNSPDAVIFTNSSSSSTTPAAPSTTTGTSSPTTGDEKSGGFPNAVPQSLAVLLPIAMAIIFSSALARGF